MKIGVFSDTHGNLVRLPAALAAMGPIDAFLHLGDFGADAELIAKSVKVPFYAVRGNCDFSTEAPAELELQFEGVRIVAVHGHQQGVKQSLLRLGLFALEKDAGILLFGHTHVPAEQFYAGATLYNPGSLGEPRGKRPTFGVITIEAGAFRIKTQTIQFSR